MILLIGLMILNSCFEADLNLKNDGIQIIKDKDSVLINYYKNGNFKSIIIDQGSDFVLSSDSEIIGYEEYKYQIIELNIDGTLKKVVINGKSNIAFTYTMNDSSESIVSKCFNCDTNIFTIEAIVNGTTP